QNKIDMYILETFLMSVVIYTVSYFEIFYYFRRKGTSPKQLMKNRWIISGMILGFLILWFTIWSYFRYLPLPQI
ncbi:MAG: hypothetical protein V3R82_03490, partial [Candidatus Hydrothermarchaeales archaeon]